MEKLKHFDLFSGYGGFSLALERVYANLQNLLHSEKPEYEAENSASLGQGGVESNNETRLGNTIGFSEIDKYASAVLKYHWPNIKNYGDISKINWAEVPDFDLLTGGSPCQDLSIAGKRAGLEGERSGLFYEYMRAVREKKPKYFIWENVKGALSSNQGRDFALVLNEMAEAGYSLWWQILNAKDFGVPQNRERIFVVGTRTGSPREVFFEAGTAKNNIKVAGELDSETWQKRNESIRRVHSPEGIAPTTPTGTGGGVMTKIIDNVKIRRLTPVEVTRLMGLPDDHLKYGINEKGEQFEISDSQKYKLAGNGVVVNVVEEVLKHIILQCE